MYWMTQTHEMLHYVLDLLSTLGFRQVFIIVTIGVPIFKIK